MAKKYIAIIFSILALTWEREISLPGLDQREQLILERELNDLPETATESEIREFLRLMSAIDEEKEAIDLDYYTKLMTKDYTQECDREIDIIELENRKGTIMYIKGLQSVYQPWRKQKIRYRYFRTSLWHHKKALRDIIRFLNKIYAAIGVEFKEVKNNADFKFDFYDDDNPRCRASLGRSRDNRIYLNIKNGCMDIRTVSHNLYYLLGFTRTTNCLRRDEVMIVTNNIKNDYRYAYERNIDCRSLPELASIATPDTYFGSDDGHPVIYDLRGNAASASRAPTEQDLIQAYVAMFCDDTNYDWEANCE